MILTNDKLMRTFFCLLNGFSLIYNTVKKLELSFYEDHSPRSVFVLYSRKRIEHQTKAIILVSIGTYFKNQILL